MRITLAIPAAIFCLATSFGARAQHNFPLVELEKLTAKNASDFETAVMEKDYTIQNKQSTAVLKVYNSDKPSADGKKSVVSRYQVPNASSKIEFTTTDKKYYLEVKSKLAAMGFKFQNEETKTISGAQANVYHYTNGAFQLTLCTYTTDANWYSVEVHQ